MHARARKKERRERDRERENWRELVGSCRCEWLQSNENCISAVCSRARPARSLVDLISYAELSTRVARSRTGVAPLYLPFAPAPPTSLAASPFSLLPQHRAAYWLRKIEPSANWQFPPLVSRASRDRRRSFSWLHTC